MASWHQPSSLDIAAYSGLRVCQHPASACQSRPNHLPAAGSLLVAQSLSRLSFPLSCFPITSWSLGKGSLGERRNKQSECFYPLLEFLCELGPIFENHSFLGLDTDSDLWQEHNLMAGIWHRFLYWALTVLSSKLGKVGGPGVWEIEDEDPLCSSSWNLHYLFGLALWEVCLELPDLRFLHTTFLVIVRFVSLFLFKLSSALVWTSCLIFFSEMRWGINK